MSKKHSRWASPSMAVAILALVLALSGTAFAGGPIAAVAKVLGLNGKQKRQVTQIADTEIGKKGPALHVAFATSAGSAASATTAGSATTAVTAANATNANNAADATNATNATYASGPVAWAEISATGAVTASRGLSSSNVSLELVAAFCFKGLTFPFHSASVTPDYSAVKNAGANAYFTLGNPDGDCSGSGVQAEVATTDDEVYSAQGFFIQFWN